MRSDISAPYLSETRRPGPSRAAAACAIAAAIVSTLLLAGPASAASVLYIRGGGYGHGVGMSQYGAYGYALHGKSYRFILAHYYSGTKLGRADPNHIVRVLLATGSAGFSGATRAGHKKLNPAATYSVRLLPDGSLGLLNQAGKQIGRFPAPLTVTGRGPLTVVGLGPYRGALEFRPDGAGGVETVDAVSLDDYVRGVVAAEMPAGWAPEALKAQAVAARTYAITTSVDGDGFDLYPDTRSQMYGGVSAETPSTDAAVAATRDQIVTYRGAPAVTYFFSSSGGYTEDIENVWPGATPWPWLRGVPDPYDGAGGNPYHRWSYELTLAEAAAKLGGLVEGQLLRIRVVERGVSPRVVVADVIGTRGHTTVTGGQLESIFGLRSTYFTFTTIATTADNSASPDGHLTRSQSQAAAEAVIALVPILRGLLGRTARTLHGNVSPGTKGTVIAIQLAADGGWRTVRHAALGANGGYAVPLADPGTYRVVCHGLDGPAVQLS